MADLPIWLLVLVATLTFIYNVQLFFVSMAGVNDIPVVAPMAKYFGGLSNVGFLSCFQKTYSDNSAQVVSSGGERRE